MPVMSRVRFTAPLAARRHSRALGSDLAFQISVVVPRKQSLSIFRSGDANSPMPTGLTDGQAPTLSVTPNAGQKQFVSSGCYAPSKPSSKSGPISSLWETLVRTNVAVRRIGALLNSSRKQREQGSMHPV
jgi:hypothetical protein